MSEQQAPMKRLIDAIRFFEAVASGGQWEETNWNGDVWLVFCDKKRNGTALIQMRISAYALPEGSAHMHSWAPEARQAAREMATILNTAIEMASLAYAVEQLEAKASELALALIERDERIAQLTQQADGWRAQAEAHAEDLRKTLDVSEHLRQGEQQKDREIAELRFALAMGGLGAVASCPSCHAERTNGEQHADDCPIMVVQRDYLPGTELRASPATDSCLPKCEVVHAHRYVDSRDGESTSVAG